MSAHIRSLKAKKAEALQAANALNAITDRELTADEQKALDGHIAQITALNAQIERAEFLANQSAGLDAGGAVEVGAAGTIQVTENAAQDPKRGFKTFGSFMKAVTALPMGESSARPGYALNGQLHFGQFNAAAPGTTMNEGAGADGGFLIPPDFSSDLFRLSLTEDSLLPMTSNVNVSGNSMVFPKTEQTPWGTNGVRAYWQAEATAATATKLALSTQTLRLHKLMGLVPLTDELMADGVALESEITPLLADSIRWKTNEAILFGNGNGQPLGAVNSGAVITQAKESGQATLTLLPMNIARMFARLPMGSFGTAVWVMNNDVLPALFTLNSNNQILYLPYGSGMGAFQGSPIGTLLGRPILISQHAQTFSSQGDLQLHDLKYYRTITKANGVQTDTSMHLYFDADATALRVTFRIDGSPKIAAPINPAKGANTLSPFVQLGAR